MAIDPDTHADVGDGWLQVEARAVGDGRTMDDPRRPDLPVPAAEYVIIEDRGLTMLVNYRPV